MRNPLILAAFALLSALGACDRGARLAAPDSYRAGGNEPFWSVTVAEGQMRLERPDFPPVVAPVTEAEATPQGLRYAAGGMTLSAAHDGCADSMSGFAFPDVATLTIEDGGLTLEGCGGDRIPGQGNP